MPAIVAAMSKKKNTIEELIFFVFFFWPDDHDGRLEAIAWMDGPQLYLEQL
jgi:hypothetical protein